MEKIKQSSIQSKISIIIVGLGISFYIIQQFIKLQEESGFSLPILKTSKTFQNNLEKAKNLNLYKTLLLWDTIFAITYGVTFYTILILLVDAKWIEYTVIIHVILDFLENYLAYNIINQYQKNKEIKNTSLYSIISTLKWGFAGWNMGNIGFRLLKNGINLVK